MSLKGSSLLWLALCGGCSAFAPKGPTDVARGEYYAAGRPDYDSFFIQLHEKQVALLSAPSEPLAVRERIAGAVGLTPDASDDALGQRLRQELQKLAGQGLRVRLEVPPPSATALDASATLHVSETSTPSALRTQLPQEATRLVRARNRMLAVKADLSKLRVTGITLEGGVSRAFRTEGPWKRDEVQENLSDGQKVITLMESRASEVEAVASGLLALLASSVTTDASLGQPLAEPAPAVAEPSRPRRAAPRSGNAERGPAPAATKPSRPAPATSPPAKRSEDDAPAPKPTQGSAPAEIEP